jgi:hypothetical protein
MVDILVSLPGLAFETSAKVGSFSSSCPLCVSSLPRFPFETYWLCGCAFPIFRLGMDAVLLLLSLPQPEQISWTFPWSLALAQGKLSMPASSLGICAWHAVYLQSSKRPSCPANLAFMFVQYFAERSCYYSSHLKLNQKLLFWWRRERNLHFPSLFDVL